MSAKKSDTDGEFLLNTYIHPASQDPDFFLPAPGVAVCPLDFQHPDPVATPTPGPVSHPSGPKSASTKES